MLDPDVDGTMSDADVTEATLASNVCLLPFPFLLSTGWTLVSEMFLLVFSEDAAYI